MSAVKERQPDKGDRLLHKYCCANGQRVKDGVVGGGGAVMNLSQLLRQLAVLDFWTEHIGNGMGRNSQSFGGDGKWCLTDCTISLFLQVPW